MIKSGWALTKGLFYLTIIVAAGSFVAGLMFGVARYAFTWASGF